MKRICLFAGFDENDIIHDYVVYYLKELSTVSDVYYMADNPIGDEEKEKIAPYVKAACGYKHGKYDFGSWQELINIIGGGNKLSEYDELILANDSCFGPLYPMRDIFNEIEQDTEWDVCGMNYNLYADRDLCGRSSYFLNSYFLIFKKNAFLSDIFKNHISSVKKFPSVRDVIAEYEYPLSKKFYENGYTVKAFLGRMYIYTDWCKHINNRHSPFIKKKIFTSPDDFEASKAYDYKGYIEKCSHIDYDVSLIDKYLRINNISIKSLYKPYLKYVIKNIRKWLIQVNIKKNRKIIRIFGIYLLNKRVDEYKSGGDTPIKTIR